MELVRFIGRAALLTIALGLIFEFFIPGGDRVVDGAAAVFAAATWIVPLGILARWQIRAPRTSLANAGFAISVFAAAASLSVIAFLLAGLTLIFARDGHWAWIGLLAVVAFWILGSLALTIFGRPTKKADSERKMQ